MPLHQAVIGCGARGEGQDLGQGGSLQLKAVCQDSEMGLSLRETPICKTMLGS